MKRLLRDKESGLLFSAMVLSKTPEGFEDITEKVIFMDDAVGIDLSLLETVEVPEVPAVPAVEGVPEHWTNGTDKVFDADDIPTLTDEQGNAFLDPDWTHVAAVAAVEEILAIPAYIRVQKKSGADQVLRQKKMDRLSALREPLLKEADIQINKLFDIDADTSAWRAYRQALRDITEPFKKVNGDWKVAVDSLDIENFQFPAKPTE